MHPRILGLMLDLGSIASWCRCDASIVSSSPTAQIHVLVKCDMLWLLILLSTYVCTMLIMRMVRLHSTCICHAGPGCCQLKSQMLVPEDCISELWMGGTLNVNDQ